MPSQPRTSRATPFVLWVSGIIVLILVALAVRSLTRERVAVSTSQATRQDVIKTSSTNGKVQPIQDYPAYAQFPGIVQDIFVNVNDRVKPGQLLLKLNDAEARSNLARAQSTLQAALLAENDIAHGGSQDDRITFAADLDRAKLQRQQDQNALTALQQLQQKGAASPAEVADVQHRLQADDNSLHSIQQHSTQRYGDADRARAQAQIADARASVLAAQSSLANANIRAPFAGTVYSIPVAEHEYVAAGADLIYVADLNRVQIVAYFDEPEIGNLAVGQPVKIVWEAKPTMVWHGHISIAPTSIITYNTRNVGECFITVDDARSDLQPNANVTVTVTTAQHLQVLSVPHDALHVDSGQFYVFRVMHDTLVRTPIQVGFVNLVRAEIVSGLSEGDIVARSAATNRDLTDGLPVTTASPVK